VLEILTTAENTVELDPLFARLRDAGIQCMGRAGGPQGGLGGKEQLEVPVEERSQAASEPRPRRQPQLGSCDPVCRFCSALPPRPELPESQR
jgi:hypothetical protein